MFASLEVTHRHPALAVNIKDTETLGELRKNKLLSLKYFSTLLCWKAIGDCQRAAGEKVFNCRNISPLQEVVAQSFTNVNRKRGVSHHTSSFGDLFCLSHRLKNQGWEKSSEISRKHIWNIYNIICIRNIFGTCCLSTWPPLGIVQGWCLGLWTSSQFLLSWRVR